MGGWGASEATEKATESGGDGNTGGWGSGIAKDKESISGDGSGWGEPAEHKPSQDANEVNVRSFFYCLNTIFIPFQQSVPPRPQTEDVDMRDMPPPSVASHRSSFSMAGPSSPTSTDATRIRPTKHRAKEPVGSIERHKVWETTVK
jgi:hypothetical protein